jgi:hypothetical protein
MLARRLPTTAFLAALLSLALGRESHAQSADSSVSSLGTTRISFVAASWLAPGPLRSLSASGSFVRFVDEHWQLGLSPAISGITGQGISSIGASLAGTANFVVGTGRLRGYAGGFAGGAGGSRGSGSGVYGAQLGGLYFLAPTSALRAELQTRSYTGPSSTTTSYLFLTIDPYLLASPGEPVRLPSSGAVDVSGSVSAGLDNGLARGLDIMLAPFITSSAQVGVHFNGSSYAVAGQRHGSSLFDGFVRLYAPAPPRAVPFVQGFAEGESNGDAIPGGLRSYGAKAGIRHYLNPGAALDIGARWRRYVEFQIGTNSYRQPNQLTLEAMIVTQLRRSS